MFPSRNEGIFLTHQNLLGKQTEQGYMREAYVLERPIVTQFEDVASPEILPIEERPLIVVDYLLKRRLPDGTYLDTTLKRAHTDLCTATKEMAIPHAISNIDMERVADGIYSTDDQTSIDVAESGLKYHHDPAARERAFVE
ncbi:MAG: hypothetical protein AAB834_00525, partial [Patescibacteria group bacterium]